MSKKQLKHALRKNKLLTSLSVVIPCYNEAQRINQSLPKIIKFLKRINIPNEIILVDDGSIDKTLAVFKSFAKTPLPRGNVKTEIIIEHYKTNMGKGFAVKRGVLRSTKDFVLMCDADLSTPIGELVKLQKHLYKSVLIIGSRRQRGAHIATSQDWLRTQFGKTFSLLAKCLLGVNIHDFTCGFKLIKNPEAKHIAKRLTINRWVFDAELLNIAKQLNYKISEVGITWTNNKDSRVRMTTDTVYSLFDLFKVVINSRLGKYR